MNVNVFLQLRRPIYRYGGSFCKRMWSFWSSGTFLINEQEYMIINAIIIMIMIMIKIMIMIIMIIIIIISLMRITMASLVYLDLATVYNLFNLTSYVPAKSSTNNNTLIRHPIRHSIMPPLSSPLCCIFDSCSYVDMMQSYEQRYYDLR